MVSAETRQGLHIQGPSTLIFRGESGRHQLFWREQGGRPHHGEERHLRCAPGTRKVVPTPRPEGLAKPEPRLQTGTIVEGGCRKPSQTVEAILDLLTIPAGGRQEP